MGNNHTKINRKKDNRKKSSRKVIKYKRRPKAAAFIFAIILIYVVGFISLYLTKSKVRTYEVDMGALTSDATFTGIALRTEEIVNSGYSGDINYYKKESSRVKVDDTICTVDETGRVSQILSQYTKSDENSLSKQNLASIKSMLNNFRTNYDGSNFYDIYNLKTDLNSAVLQAMNENIIANLDSIISSTGSQNLFQTIKSEKSGVVAYYTDGYENVTTDNLSADLFNKNNYKKENLKSEDIVVAGSPAYKLVTDENWYICIMLDQKDISAYELDKKSSVSIKIKKDNIITSGSFTISNKDGNYYGIIGLNKYMIRYANERFLDIELTSTSNTGLKIPVSAITEEEFYTIPKAYLTTGGNSNTYGFICEEYSTNGDKTTRFVTADIYKSNDNVCYVSKEDFTAGSNIVKPDSTERYVIGAVEKLKGVYCINTGYTTFKLVDIIDENNEYVISKKSISHGVSIYDRIVLDAEKYSLNQLIY